MAQTLFTAATMTETLVRVVNLAVTTVDGCDYAGLLFPDSTNVVYQVHTNAVVPVIDGLQHRTNKGPAIDAIAHRMVFYSGDLSTDLRWPHFSSSAAALGIRSVLALPLTADAQFGAVNLYARSPSAWGVVDRARAAILAALAGFAFSVAHSHDDELHRADNFQTALPSRGDHR
jgi:hypothetical protein